MASRYVLPIRMYFGGHLMRMDVAIWSILIRKKLHTYSWSVYFKMWLFTDKTDGPGIDQSWVTHLFV